MTVAELEALEGTPPERGPNSQVFGYVVDPDGFAGFCFNALPIWPVEAGEQGTMQSDIDRLMTAYENGRVSRRIFLGSLAALAVAPPALAQTGPPIPVRAINHMTLSVSDPTRSLEWYQGR